MKRIGLLIVCMLGVLSAHAQWSVSPEVGLSAFRRNTYYEWRPAIKLGAAVEYQFKPHFSLESGLYYTQRGFSLTEYNPGPYHEEPSLVRHMFQIPLRARFSWEVANDVHLFFGTGPYLGIYFVDDWNHTVLHRNDDTGNVAEIGLSTMVGVEVKRFFVRLGHEVAFVGYHERYLNGWNHCLTLSVGYRF